MFGPGEPGFVHTEHEVVSLAEVDEAAAILAELTVALCG